MGRKCCYGWKARIEVRCYCGAHSDTCGSHARADVVKHLFDPRVSRGHHVLSAICGTQPYPTEHPVL
jgi:hypothetical protein